MKWKKAPEELVTFLSESMTDVDCQMKKVFGYPAYFINNNMFIGAHQESLIIRLSKEDREKVMNLYDGIIPFEPMPGRGMKEYVVLPEYLYHQKDRFSEILDMSINYVTSLPPKEKKR